LETRFDRGDVVVCARLDRADEVQIGIEFDAACRDASILHAQGYGTDTTKRVQNEVGPGESKMIGDVVSELRGETGREPIPSMDRQVELSLKRDRLRAAVGEVRSHIEQGRLHYFVRLRRSSITGLRKSSRFRFRKSWKSNSEKVFTTS